MTRVIPFVAMVLAIAMLSIAVIAQTVPDGITVIPDKPDLAVSVLRSNDPGGWMIQDLKTFAFLTPMVEQEGKLVIVVAPAGDYNALFFPKDTPYQPKAFLLKHGNFQPPPPAELPKIQEFTVVPQEGPKGTAFTLSWKVTPATAKVKIDGQDVAVTGSRVVTPQQSASYEITASVGSVTVKEQRRLIVTDKPPPPIPQSGLFVVVVEDVKNRDDLPAEQVAALTSVKLRQFLDKNCAKEGGRPAYRFLATTDDVSKLPKVWQDAMKIPHPGINAPYWIISNGTEGVVEPFPATTDAAITRVQEFSK